MFRLNYLLIFTIFLSISLKASPYFSHRKAYFQRHLILHSEIYFKKDLKSPLFSYGLKYRIGGFSDRADLQLALSELKSKDLSMHKAYLLLSFPDVETRSPLALSLGFGGGILKDKKDFFLSYKSLISYRLFNFKKKHLGFIFDLGFCSYYYILSKKTDYFYLSSIGLQFVF